MTAGARPGATALMVCALLAATVPAQTARLLLQDDPAGTVLAGPHTEKRTYPVAGNGGCQTFQTTPDRAQFNYTSTITYAALPKGCSVKDLQVTKVYTRGACAETRANNYGDKSAGITNATGCKAIAANDTATCTTTFGTAPAAAVLTGVASGTQIDRGEVCWDAQLVYVFVKNDCSSPITVTISNLFDDYDGSCIENDGDDGDKTATASNSGGEQGAAAAASDAPDGEPPSSASSATDASDTAGSDGGDSGLSTGAKVGIAVGVVAAVASIAAAIAYLCCCQLRRGGGK